MGAVLLLALAWAAIVWSRPAPIRIAFANSLTGPSGPAGLESLVATRLAIDEVNANGGIRGRPIELVPFDDASSAETARANVQAIADSPCVAVLGHYLSTTSLAAGPGYKSARIPALTGTSFVNDLTRGNEFYFRAQTTSSLQGRSIAEYLRAVMKEPKVHLVHSRDRFGSSFLQGFAQGYEPGLLSISGLDIDPAGRIGPVTELLDARAGQSGPDVIVIGTGADYIADIVKAVRRGGVKAPIIAAGGAGHEGYLQNFVEEPEEKQNPGFFTENLYASPPLIFDSAGTTAQTFAAAYTTSAGTSPSWVAAGAHDAARVLADALGRADILNRPDSKAADREKVRAALAAIDSPKTAVAGLTGRLYFNADRDIPRPVRLGYFHHGRFVTAPLQLVQVEAPDAVDLAAEREKGHVASFGNRHYWVQHVVYTGIDIVRLNRVDVKQGTFNVDFYLWMRFAGDDDGQTQVQFPALLDSGAFDPARPLQIGQEDGLNYRLYRINGDFKARYELHNYPFDAQQLLLHFRNTQQRQELVTYVIDRFGLRLADERSSLVEDGAYSGLELWRFLRLRYFVEFPVERLHAGQGGAVRQRAENGIRRFRHCDRAASQLGHLHAEKPAPVISSRARRVRDAILPRNAVPRAGDDPRHRDPDQRGSAPGAWTTNSATFGYTVAVEKIFYVFFALCLMTMLAGFGHERLRHAGRKRLCAVVRSHRPSPLCRNGARGHRLVLVALCPVIRADRRELSDDQA